MKIQLDIPPELNDKLKIDRIKKKLRNKQDLVLFIIERYFGEGKNGRNN